MHDVAAICVGIPDHAKCQAQPHGIRLRARYFGARAAGVAKDRLWVPVCVFSALVNQQGQPHPQSMDSMKGLSEFEDLQYTSYHATIGGSAVDVLLHHRLR